MAYWIQETASIQNRNSYKLFYCDYVSDINKLPKYGIDGEKQGDDSTAAYSCAYGSECKCLENSSMYILSKDTNEWKIQTSNSISGGSSGGTGVTNYEDLNNLPSIEGIVIKGNITLNDLGIQPKGNYLTKIPDDYITESQLKNIIQTETEDLDFSTLFD